MFLFYSSIPIIINRKSTLSKKSGSTKKKKKSPTIKPVILSTINGVAGEFYHFDNASYGTALQLQPYQSRAIITYRLVAVSGHSAGTLPFAAFPSDRFFIFCLDVVAVLAQNQFVSAFQRNRHSK